MTEREHQMWIRSRTVTKTHSTTFDSSSSNSSSKIHSKRSHNDGFRVTHSVRRSRLRYGIKLRKLFRERENALCVSFLLFLFYSPLKRRYDSLVQSRKVQVRTDIPVNASACRGWGRRQRLKGEREKEKTPTFRVDVTTEYNVLQRSLTLKFYMRGRLRRRQIFVNRAHFWNIQKNATSLFVIKSRARWFVPI